jgi:hypothetical protein
MPHKQLPVEAGTRDALQIGPSPERLGSETFITLRDEPAGDDFQQHLLAEPRVAMAGGQGASADRI